MQSIGKLAASQAEYYTAQLRHSVGEDVPVLRGERRPAEVEYYAGHESPSRWMGSGGGRLGLEAGSPVDTETFARLMAHETPAGEAMTVARSHGRVAAFDHTFSAPKSVSLLYAFGDDRVRAAVVAAHRAAVAAGLGYMEERCASSRVGVRFRDGEGRPRFTTRSVGSEGYVAAGFDHFTSRANDPQVHTHVVVINRVWADGGWRALDAKRAYAHAKAGGSVYQAVLRSELTGRLGVRWQPVANGVADVAGFSPELVRHFSTRRGEIAAAVDRYLAERGGEAHRRVWQTFTLETRQPKARPRGEPAVTREMKDYGVDADVVSHWWRRAADAPDDPAAAVARAVAAGGVAATPSVGEVEAAAGRLVAAMSERQAVFTERDLLAHVAALFPAGAPAGELVAATRLVVDTAQRAGEVLPVVPYAAGMVLPDGVTLSDGEAAAVAGTAPGPVGADGAVRFRALPGEARYTTRAHLERERRVLAAVSEPSPVRVDPALVEEAAAARGLVDAQRAAMRRLAGPGGRLVAVVGPGGSGKTYSVGAYADAVAASGGRVVGVAVSAAAALRLGGDLGDGAWTGTVALLRRHLEEAPLAPGTVVVVDEASMVSTADLAWLVDHTPTDGRLVLLGDPHQLPSVDSGGLFPRIVAARVGVVDDLAAVNERQRLDLDRRALLRLRAGDAAGAVRDYTDGGRVHLGRDEYATKAALVDAWWADTSRHGVAAVRMLASRRDEVELLNRLARVRMAQAGNLTGPAVTNRWGAVFQAGDRVVVRDNWYEHADLRNGQAGTVVAVDPGRGVTFRRDLDGASIALPRRYLDRDVDHGYAQTIHTAQGQTFEVTHVYMDTGMGAEPGYTALSRARSETHLWLADTPGPLGECTHIHGDPLTEDRIGALVRQLRRSVIEPPTLDQGLPVADAADRQLLAWRDELDAAIRHSPLAHDPADELAALDAALAEARALAAAVATSGARDQVRALQTRRDELAAHAHLRAEWLAANTHLLHRYAAVSEEISHRVAARAALYRLDPPDDFTRVAGPRPPDPAGAHRWDTLAAIHARARLTAGPHIDLTDPTHPAGAPWRDHTAIQPEPHAPSRRHSPTAV